MNDVVRSDLARWGIDERQVGGSIKGRMGRRVAPSWQLVSAHHASTSKPIKPV